MLFRSIDKNGDGKVGKEELRMAFQSAGLAVPNSRLEGFFSEIDMNNDGYISFDEWRYVSSPSSIPVAFLSLFSWLEIRPGHMQPPKTWQML